MESPSLEMYRHEAVSHHLRGAEAGPVLRVSPPWTWALLWIVVTALLVALIASIVGSVEVNSRALAVLRPGGGVKLLTSQVSGIVSAVESRSGQEIRAGGVLLRIHAAELEGQLLESQRQVDLLRTDFKQVMAVQQRLQREQEQHAQVRIGKTAERASSLRASLSGAERKAVAIEGLASSNLVSQMDVIEAREAVAQARRELAAAEEGVASGRQDLASIENRRQADQWQQQQALENAESRREALTMALQQTVLRAPQDGSVEALMVEPGDIVRQGQTLAKLIPAGASLRVISFLPEKDRAFIKLGSEVRLELEQLPYGEFGSLGARVVRISGDVASTDEVEEALGDGGIVEGATYRVELEVVDTSASEAAGIRLRSGMMMQARFTLRRQRLITMVLEPLRRWFE